MDAKIFKGLLESLLVPVVFVDNTHVISYMNQAGADRYQKHGGQELLGKSVFACHKENSNRIIRDVYAKFQAGEDGIYIYTSSKNEKVFMKAVRGDGGNLLGYYKRYEAQSIIG